MLTADSNQLADHVHCKEETIVLAGPPSALFGEITFENPAKEPVWIKDLPFRLHSAKKGAPSPSLMINTVLTAGETRAFPLNIELPTDTPPGQYQATLSMSTKDVVVNLVVEPIMEIELVPDTLTFLGLEPGKNFKAKIQLNNLGNLPVVIPETELEESLDIDLVTKTLAAAVRAKGDQGTMPVLDAFVENLRRELTPGLLLKIKETGAEIAPGKSLTLNIDITLPKKLPSINRLEADVVLLDELLSIEILPDTTQKREVGKKIRSAKK